jgi:ABC-type amino acid transport substrate-binding protein
MRHWILVGLLLVSWCCQAEPPVEECERDLLSTIEARQSLIIGVKQNSPPFSLRDKDGIYVGLEPDLARAIGVYILGDDARVVFKPLDVHQRLSALESGEVDLVIATFSITPARNTRVSFSQPYFFTHQGVLVDRKQAVRLTDLKGKTVFVVQGSNSASAFFELQPETHIVTVEDYEEAVRRLQAGEAAGLSSDMEILTKLAPRLGEEFWILPEHLGRQEYAVGVLKSARSAGLLFVVNQAMDHMIAHGFIQKLVSENFKRYAPELAGLVSN